MIVALSAYASDDGDARPLATPDSGDAGRGTPEGLFNTAAVGVFAPSALGSRRVFAVGGGVCGTLSAAGDDFPQVPLPGPFSASAASASISSALSGGNPPTACRRLVNSSGLSESRIGGKAGAMYVVRETCSTGDSPRSSKSRSDVVSAAACPELLPGDWSDGGRGRFRS